VIADEILQYYRAGKEEERLKAAVGRLEQARTWDILDRHLPQLPARVLDVGGATGVYAIPLARRGYEVHLIDPVPLHVERAQSLARAAGVTLQASIGDARALEQPDAAFDAVLLFGPLYHLTARSDRVGALSEARRVLSDGGAMLAAYISRFASACDGILSGALKEPAFAEIVDQDLATGIHQNPTGRLEWFTTAYFHKPEEIRSEIHDAGLAFHSLLAVEGPGWMGRDPDAWLDDEGARGRLLDVLRRVETEPSLIGVSAHLMAHARR
jgi:ubiquinone/menaquinone biosynthesis C-methylase UbiE